MSVNQRLKCLKKRMNYFFLNIGGTTEQNIRPIFIGWMFFLFLGGRHMEMKPKYDPREVEKGRYEEWVSNGYFKPSEDKSKEAYTIVIPPLM